MKKKSRLDSLLPVPPVDQYLESVFLDDSFTVGTAVKIEPTLTYTVEPTFNGRYGYHLRGEPAKIKAAFEAIRNNVPIGCNDVITSIKAARTALFAAKSAGVRR